MLLCYILDINKENLITYEDEEIDEGSERIFKSYVNDLKKGKPIQYITHHQEFMGLSFYVDENVLIPQPDTEILVEEALKEIKLLERKNNIEKTFRILDLCTGSGAIAISLAKYLESDVDLKNQVKFEVYATDISEKALEIAKKNAEYHRSINYIHSIKYV